MISIKNLKKIIDGRTITNNVTLTIPEGQMTVIIGRSGEGKSLLLKQIIGLIQPTSGSIVIDGQDITQLSGQEKQNIFKNIGYVFQSAALLDSLNVWENIGISLARTHTKHAIIEKVKKKLALVHLPEETLYKYPSELSGGMAKRVGLARTLITNPKIILYDEPTSGLDPLTERRIHELMHQLQIKFKTTSVVITHSTDIFEFADNVALLYNGSIAYFGTAKKIWESSNPYVHQFIRGSIEGPIQNTE